MTKINSKLALAEIDTKVLAKANLIILLIFINPFQIIIVLKMPANLTGF